MSFERYLPVMTDLDACIRPKNSETFTFDGSGCEGARRLFLTGETNIDPFWKSEPDYQMLYRRIDDSLRSDLANRDRFCLDFSGDRRPYPKLAYKKPVAPLRTPMFVLNDSTDRWIFGVDARAEDFSDYRLLIAVGYSRAEDGDLEKLYGFVKRGGTLLIGWPQQSVTANRADAVACDHIFGDGRKREFVKDTYRSHPVSVCEEIEYDAVLVRTDAERSRI